MPSFSLFFITEHVTSYSYPGHWVSEVWADVLNENGIVAWIRFHFTCTHFVLLLRSRSANSGLGKDAARQLSLLDGVKKVYLGCRNEEKAKAAKADLEKITGKKDAFEVLVIDVSSLESVRNSINNFKPSEPLNGLILNAGGVGGPEPAKITEDGVTTITAANLLGHTLMTDMLLDQNKLSKGASVVYAGSEAARGVPSFGMAKPVMKTWNVEEYVSIFDGSQYSEKEQDMNHMYGPVKLSAAMWMSSMARKQPDVRFITMSPGATSGTGGIDNVGAVKRVFFNTMFAIMKLVGVAHGLETGTKRYIDALTDEDTYKTGVFYASKKGTTGPVCDQVVFMEELTNQEYQDNANIALHNFIK